MSKVPASKLIKKAKAYEKKGDLARARHAYETVLNNYPNNKNARLAIQDLVAISDTPNDLDPPKHVMAQLETLYKNRYFNDALQLAEQLAVKYPKSFYIWNFVGLSSHKLNNIKIAEHALRTALEINPNAAKIFNNLASIVKASGRINEAIELYERAIEIEPLTGGYYRNLVAIKKFSQKDGWVNRILNIMVDPDLATQDKCELNFALAKIYEDIVDLEQAYIYLKEGNKLRKQLLNYDIQLDIDLFKKIKVDAAKFSDLSVKYPAGEHKVKPIFIVGMPRSGTSLVEQIISSHGCVTAAGELDYIYRLASLFLKEQIQYTADNVLDVRNQYLGVLASLSAGNNYVTDKAPHNFCFLSLIYTAFPDAKVVHVVRDPAAVCWSNFKNYFVNNGIGYCYDLKDTVQYYKLYENLMSYWNELYPSRCYTLDYEKLVIDQEAETRKVMNYLELEWDKNCLVPEKNQRAVQTVSQQQVRKKIYSGSKDHWRKFEPFLNGEFDSLT